MKLILSVIFYLFLTSAGVAQITAPETISIDRKATVTSFPKSFFYSIGAGRANEGLRADWQQQLSFIQQNIPFQYLRFHGIFADDMGVYFEDKEGKPIFNFQYIDVLFDLLLSQNIRPFVEFGFMPKLLASTPQTLFWWNANISYPKDGSKWVQLIEASVNHWIERYGINEVKQWYFEVWNEPNLKDLFFSGTQEDYFRLYTLTANAVKNVNKDLRVGGPATAGMAWLPEFIEYCTNHNVPLDFVSTHHYGVKSGFLDHLGDQTTVLHEDPLAIGNAVQQSRKEILNSSQPHLSLHFTEWSSSYTPRDPFHDSYLSAAYILHQLNKVDSFAMNMSYWTFTDIFEENGPRYTPFHGGFGLINYQSIPKASFFAYKYLAALGEKKLAVNHPTTLVGLNEEGGVNILTWDYSHQHPSDSIGNQHYYNQDLPSKKIGVRNLELKNFNAGNYELTVYKTGYENNDAYTAYIKMGKPQQLSKAQVEDLKKASTDLPIETQVVKVDKSGNLIFPISMNQNEIILIKIKKIKTSK